MPKVTIRSGESEQQLLRRFKQVVVRSGIFGEVRKRRWFVSKTEQRRMAKKKAIRRQNRRIRKKTS